MVNKKRGVFVITNTPLFYIELQSTILVSISYQALQNRLRIACSA